MFGSDAGIADAAKAANVQYPVQQMAEGWIAGMVVEAALKATGWPATPEKLAAAMQTWLGLSPFAKERKLAS